MIFLSIFICFYLFFFRRQRRNFLYLTHVKTSSCGTIERIKQIFLTTNLQLGVANANASFWLSWRKPRPDGFPRAAKALPIREIRVIRSCRNKSVKSAKSAVLLLASVFCLRQTQVFTSEPFFSFLLSNVSNFGAANATIK